MANGTGPILGHGATVEDGKASGIQSTFAPDLRGSATAAATATTGAAASDLLRARHSSRQFSDSPLPDQVVHEIIEQAAWAPSGGNVQPWRVAVLRPAAVKRLLESSEADSLYLIEPMVKLAFVQLAEREQRLVQPELNQCVVSKVVPSLKMSEAPPSHVVVVYSERKRVVGRLRDVALGVSLTWYRFWHTQGTQQRFHYLWLMLVNFVRLLATDDAVRAMSLSNFVYALTLAAQSRSIDSCIQCQFVVLRNRLRRLLALDRRFELFACVSLGYPRERSNPEAQRFPNARYPVPTQWVD